MDLKIKVIPRTPRSVIAGTMAGATRALGWSFGTARVSKRPPAERFRPGTDLIPM